jgi:hypothetical protein
MGRNMSIVIVGPDGSERAVHRLVFGSKLKVDEGDKIKRGQPVQTTIDEIEESGEDYAPAHNFDDERIARTLASTKGLDKAELPSSSKEPKSTPSVDTAIPAPSDTNGLTRKDADAQFAAAMAPDPDVAPLSSLPTPVPAPQGQTTGIQEEGVDAGTVVWAQSVFGSIQSALDKLECIVGTDSENAAAPGLWFRLEPETAQKLMELCDWHQQENGKGLLIDQKLNDVVNSFHAAKLEMRAEAEAAKAALAATLPVFEVPEERMKAATPEEIERGVKQLKDDAISALYDTPQGIADGLDEFAGRLV